MKREVMDLWRLCFEDTEEFIRFYFNRKYKDENTLVCRDKQGNIVAALQMPLYLVTFAGTLVQAGYISGACTHPLARARGIMAELLREAFGVMRKRGIPLSVLIPADDWLYGYYGKMGYATVFDFSPEQYVVSDHFLPGHFQVEAVRDEALVTDDLFLYFERAMLQRACCVQHDREDFNMIVEDLRISGGALIVAYAGEKHIVGMAFAEPRGNHVLVKDWLFDTEDVKQALLSGVMAHLDAAEIQCRSLPTGKNDEHRGMARILDVEQVLQLYAVRYPEQHFVLKVTDEQIPENTGIYIVGKGACSRETSGEFAVELTVQELTRLLFGYYPRCFPGLHSRFKSFHPFISLMLD